MENGPHQGQPVLRAGVPLSQARAAMILVHGRGASAESILLLANTLAQPGVAYLAPQAAGNTWYPYSFLEPLGRNEPGLSSGLRALDDVLSAVGAAGVAPEQTVLLGFSQGACLTLEYGARRARRFGGLVGLSGGLIGTGQRTGEASPQDKRFEYDGSLEGTPVFLGCSDRDAHIPLQRVEDSAEVLRRLGGAVTKRIYPGMGHVVNDDEVDFVRSLLASLVGPAPRDVA